MSNFDNVPLREQDDSDGSEDEEQALLGNGDNSGPIKMWDSFREFPPKQDSGSQGTIEIIDISVRILKLLAYIVTFIVVLATGILSKVTFFLMTSQLQSNFSGQACLSDSDSVLNSFEETSNAERYLWTWVIFFVFCVPELGSFLRSLRMVTFKINHKPLWDHFLLVFIGESFHVIGLSLLAFHIFPSLDVIRCAMLTNAVCLVPGLLKILTWDKEDSIWMIKVTGDSLAILAQITALFVWPIVESSNNNGSSLWIMLPALILTSCGWWLNFYPYGEEPLYKIDMAKRLATEGATDHPKTKEERSVIKEIKQRGLKWYFWSVKGGINESTMYWTYLYISLWKIVLFFVCMLCILEAQANVSVQEFFDMTSVAFQERILTGNKAVIISEKLLGLTELTAVTKTNSLAWLWVGLIHGASSYLCYIFSKFACKILIQRIGMVLPNILVVPGTIAVLATLGSYYVRDPCFFDDVIPSYLFFKGADVIGDDISTKVLWIWIIWLISQIWITLHTWYPCCDKLAPTEKLFCTPMYSTILPDQSILLNRIEDETPDLVEEVEQVNYQHPRIIACATMWHEQPEEMLEMLKSVLRMDLDQCVRQMAYETLKTTQTHKNFYEYETHILFDDVFELEDEEDEDEEMVLNEFVRNFLKALPKAVKEVHGTNKIQVDYPLKYPTPYGGRLEYTLPGGTKMYVHLKNKDKIRHRKRWSQCMYMYYLLGYKLMDNAAYSDPKTKDAIAQNTFLLALDGDIDFQPKAVTLLVDLMKKNKNLGAACGRIHPVGSGMMAWYQIFEYAIGHWLQKATEHMIGCVLCSPGCFSLFRGKALMDDNVMRTYTKECEAARHMVQYDQGEDRWLCTLILKRGYRVEYSAASDAFTHCPEAFNEFFTQRRRWVPSTMANILDLLGDYKRTVKVNGNISMPYIIYQTMLMAGTILGPGTIFLMLVGAFVAAFQIANWDAFLYNLVPIILFIGICLFLKGDTQLMFALLISTIYALIMMAVLVGILLQIQEDGPLAPSTLFLFIAAGEIIVAGLLHPQEVMCLPSGTIYYITIPAMYLLLIIYSVCNLNVVSWGTREVKQKKSKAELEEEKKQAEAEEKKKQKEQAKSGFLGFLGNLIPGGEKRKEDNGGIEFSMAGLFRCMFCTQPKVYDEREHLVRIDSNFDGVKRRLDNIERLIDPTSQVQSRRRTTLLRNGSISSQIQVNVPINDEIVNDIEEPPKPAKPKIIRTDDNPYWIEDKVLRKSKTEILHTEEKQFWEEMIGKYLKPLIKDKEKEAKMSMELKKLRDQTVLAFFMLNAIFVVIIFLLQLKKDVIFINWPLGVKSNISFDTLSKNIYVDNSYLKLEPIGFVFVIFFVIILVVQFIGMLLHRFETLCHLLSTTSILPGTGSGIESDTLVERTRENIQKAAAKEHIEEYLDEDVVSRRKTVQVLQEEVKNQNRKTVNFQEQVKSHFEKEKSLQDESMLENERRQSTSLMNRISRRISVAPRKSAARRATMAMATISEGEEGAVK